MPASVAAAAVSVGAKATTTDPVTILLHKPPGADIEAVAHRGQPAPFITPRRHWAEDPSRIAFAKEHLAGLSIVSRLDVEASGLVVFTQDRDVAKRFRGSGASIEYEYLVQVEDAIAPAGLTRLERGLSLDGRPLKSARASQQSERQLRLVLREWQPNQVRRMCEAIGLKPVAVRLIRLGSLPLSKLPEGAWRFLRQGEKL